MALEYINFDTISDRPEGLKSGDYTFQSTGDLIFEFYLSLGRYIITSNFAENIGDPLILTFVNTIYNLGIHSLGTPSNPNDQSQVQPARDNPPQVNRSSKRWWFDFENYVRRYDFSLDFLGNVRAVSMRTFGLPEYIEKDLILRRPLGSRLQDTSGSVVDASFSPMTVVTPGNATKSGKQALFVSDDGSVADPLDFRVPVRLGLHGFGGGAGQTFPESSEDILHFQGFFKASLPNFSIVDTTKKVTSTHKFGSIGNVRLGYEMTLFSSTQNFQKDDGGCVSGDNRIIAIESIAVSGFVVLQPIGDKYEALIWFIPQHYIIDIAGSYYQKVSGPITLYCAQLNTQTISHSPDVFDRFEVAFNDTTSISVNIYNRVHIDIDITVNSVGGVTLIAEVKPQVTISNSGPGWHDKYERFA